MNFFKSVFADDPEPPKSDSASETPKNAPENEGQEGPDRDSSPIEPDSEISPSTDASAAGGWNFGGLIRTLTTKSESIIDTYRRDLQEFGTGLKKEIEVAQGSLETVGHAFDEFGNTVVKGTAQIISQGKDVILAANLESDSDKSNSNSNTQKFSGQNSLNSKAYSRFDAQVRAIQGDASTYCEEPEDLNDYNNWKSEFSLEGKADEIEGFLRENNDMESIYNRVVPNTVDHETFCYRYYYKVYKLKKAEEVRARLVTNVSWEDEDLSWDVEDDDGDKEYEGKTKSDLMTNKKVGGEDVERRADAELQVGSSSTGNEIGTKRSNVEDVQNSGEKESTGEEKDNLLSGKELENKTDKSVEESKPENTEVIHQIGDGNEESIKEARGDNAQKSDRDDSVNESGRAAQHEEESHKNDPAEESEAKANKTENAVESEGKSIVERKADDGKDNNSSLVSNQQSAQEEEDLGWDEIEDLSSIDEKKATQSGSVNKVDLRKRLSAAEEEEDLSWDIEDDDEPHAKA